MNRTMNMIHKLHIYKIKHELINTINRHRPRGYGVVADTTTQQNILFVKYVSGRILDFDFTQEPPPRWFRLHKYRDDILNLAKLYIKINR